MKHFRRILTCIIAAAIVFGGAAGIFGPGGSGRRASAAPGIVAFDTGDRRVSELKQTVTGSIDASFGATRAFYRVYSTADRGGISLEGEASLKNGKFSIEGLKLKPDDNTVVVTAVNARGEKATQKVTYTYDSASIKQVKARHLKKAGDSGLMYAADNLLVYFEPGVSDERRLEIIDGFGGRKAGYINAVNMWQVELPVSSLERLQALADELTALPDVFYASVNYAKSAKSALIYPNDPWYSTTPGYTWNEYYPEGNNWSAEAIQAPSAWGYQYFFSQVKAGVVDDGVQVSHPDLAGKVFFPSTYWEGHNNSSAWHGTHVNGIIGAVPNNNIGVTGIPWDVKMYNCNWNFGIDTDANIYAGLTDTVLVGAKVVNFSLGSAIDLEEYGANPETNTYVRSYARNCEAVMTPLLNQGFDFIVVQSAGNGTKAGYSKDAIFNGYFCSVTYTNLLGTTEMVNKINARIIIVGAAERVSALSFMQAEWSNAGSQVDICAPGVNVYSTYTGSSYNYLSGTSMAAPEVTGIAALAWSVNPNFTGAQVRGFVVNIDPAIAYTVADNTSIYHPLVSTYKMANAKMAVEAAINACDPDYSGVNAAVAMANSKNEQLYTPQSWAALQSAVNAVNYSLGYINQPQIDAMETAILNAINALILKTVSYTVEYRLESVSGQKIAADKTGSGQVTTTVTENAKAVTGYTPLQNTKSLELALSGNVIVFIYINRPTYVLSVGAFKNIGGQTAAVTSARAGDTVTVRVTPSTNFYCGSSKFVVMYDMNFYTLVGSGTSAFTVNAQNPYIANTNPALGGVTTSPVNQWPATFVNGESSVYKYVIVSFTASTANFPTVMTGEQWLFSFNLQVNAGASGSGRIFMDERWTRTTANPTGLQYFFWCADAATPCSSGVSVMDYAGVLSAADISLTLDTKRTVTFDLNGGTGTAPAAQNLEIGSQVNLPVGSGFTREYYTFLGWAADSSATAALTGYTVTAADATLYAVWQRIMPSMRPADGSPLVMDAGRGFLYGFFEMLSVSSLANDFISVTGDATVRITSPGGNLAATGARVELVDNVTGLTVQSYDAVLYGDTDKNGRIDGADSVTVLMLAQGMLSQSAAGAAVCEAADVNFDGVIDAIDAEILQQAGLLQTEISQYPT
ncbi:MAG: Subtilisin E precursor [Firmicutes bacterium ADurb.Bin262]|nr:MAG: Subtilisin E precursor [Firmicutes bacterium ADurb.Bin262]